MRDLLRQHLIADGQLVALIPAARWYGSGSVIDTPARPFAELRFGGTTRGVSEVMRVRCSIWVHDDEGSYARINQVLRRLREVLDGAEHLSSSGAEIILATWMSDSFDMYDDGYRTFVRSAEFDLVGTGE